jgi:hypothetical protein
MAQLDISDDKEKIVKEVHNIENIEAKTELNSKQVETVNKMKTWSTVFGAGLVNSHLHDFLVLQKSKDRRSMTEFVEALKSKKDDFIDKAKNLAWFG